MLAQGPAGDGQHPKHDRLLRVETGSGTEGKDIFGIDDFSLRVQAVHERDPEVVI